MLCIQGSHLSLDEADNLSAPQKLGGYILISKEKDFQEFFPVWNKLTAGQQEQLEHAVRYEHAKKGTIIHNGSLDCVGVLLIHSGQLRA